MHSKKFNLISSAQRTIAFGNNSFEVESFGMENESIIFYVIRQQSQGRGLFSLVSSVLCHLDIAKRHSFIPVVDFENFTTVYNDGEVEGTRNAWEYYFLPVSDYTLNEVYSSKNVIFSSNRYPIGYDYSITNVKGLYEIYVKYIKYNSKVLDAVGRYETLFEDRILGIHYRGQEMRTARGHWLPPSLGQILYGISTLNKEHVFNKIFVVSEDENLVASLVDRYGDLVFYTNSYRTNGVNAYKQYPRDKHFYKLGFEILVDTLLLSKATGIIKCSSNVAEFATFINNGKYHTLATVDNGPNTNLWPFNYIVWPLRNLLPSNFFGFSPKSVIFSSNGETERLD